MQHVKHVFQYLVLVGVPFVGLLGVLRVGRDLAAPMAVHGRYTVIRMDGEAGGCLGSHLSDSTVAVSQSGARIEVAVGWHALRLDGRLDGDRLTAEGELPAAAGCPTGERVRLEARAARGAGPARLAVRLRAECPDCGPVALDAVRTPGATPGR